MSQTKKPKATTLARDVSIRRMRMKCGKPQTETKPFLRQRNTNSPPKRKQKTLTRCGDVNAKTPMTTERGDFGDMYAINVMSGNVKIDNPLADYFCITLASIDSLKDLGLNTYRVTPLVDIEPRLSSYVRIATPRRRFKRSCRSS